MNKLYDSEFRSGLKTDIDLQFWPSLNRIIQLVVYKTRLRIYAKYFSSFDSRPFTQRGHTKSMSLQISIFRPPPPSYVTQKTIDDVILNNDSHSSYKPPSTLRWVAYFLHTPEGFTRKLCRLILKHLNVTSFLKFQPAFSKLPDWWKRRLPGWFYC